MVSAAGLAPAVSRAQTERVAPTLRTENSERLILETSEWRNAKPNTLAIGSAVRFATKRHKRHKKLADPKGVGFPSLIRWIPQMSMFAIANCNAPTLFPQTTGCFPIQLRERNGLPSRSSRIASAKVRLRALHFDTGFTDQQPD